MAISRGRPIRPKGVCEIANGSAPPIRPLRDLPFLWRRGYRVHQSIPVPKSRRHALRDRVELLCQQLLWKENAGKANADGYRSGVFASGISAADASRV